MEVIPLDTQPEEQRSHAFERSVFYRTKRKGTPPLNTKGDTQVALLRKQKYPNIVKP
jgi:hypothetical protein